ncbi:ATPase family AAA domain-containing protein 5-like isoform X2 [Penaeus japonicus]|uniref:ATPase family AAA domain-containing protein 5-like isoform X2 n=1 Tax=Penaeus japonicus TaxID=27405 RepID=UPI001C70F156|nr:ATPase family AAA domain-containing protein 5-like isoform X2 [Penaeus japonicus]
MPSATEVQNIPQREKGQRGIDSFFKSPKAASPVVKDKKDLFAYFKKVNGSPDHLNGSGSPKESKHGKEEVIEICGNESENSAIIDVESEGSETDENVQGSSSQTDESSAGDLADEGSSTVSEDELEVVEVVKEKTHKTNEKSVEESSSGRQNVFAFMMANRCKQNEVLREMKEEEEAAENGHSETLTKKKGVVSSSEGEEHGSKKSEKVNVSNGTVHVDESGTKKTSKDKKTTRRKKKPVRKIEQATDTESSSESCEELEVVFQKKDDSNKSNSSTPAVAPQPKVNKVPMSYSGGNAFAFMMANRHKQDKALSENESGKGETSESENNDKSSAPTDSIEKKGKGRKKKQIDLDSSLADFEVSEIEEPKKKTKKIVRKKKTNVSVSGNSNIPDQTPEVKAEEGVTKPQTIETTSKEVSKITKTEGSQVNNITVSNEEGECQTSIKNEREDLETKTSETSANEDKNVKQKNVKMKTTKGKKGKVVVKNKKTKNNNQEVVTKKETESNQEVNLVDEMPVEQNVAEERQIDSKIVKKKRVKKKNVDAALQVPKVENSDSVTIESAEAEEPPRKRRRKIVNYSADSDNEDEETTDKTHLKTEPEETEKKEDIVTDGDTENSSKKGNISTFFKKITKEEKAVERSKNIFTIKVDVHAPCDGLLESNKVEHVAKKKKTQDSETADKENVNSISKDKKNDRRTSRRIKKRQELEELNKIELLEQITPTNSPVKQPAQSLREINIINNDVLKKEEDKNTIAEATAKESKISETKENIPKKVGKKASKRILQEEENVCGQMEESKTGEETKISQEDLPLDEEKTEKKEPLKLSRRRLSSRKAINEPSATVEPAVLPKENTLSESIAESIENVAEDEIFPKSTRASRAKSLNRSAQDNNTDTDTSIGSRKRSPRTRDGLLSESMESEDDKENVVRYTSTLIQKPGKLSLRLKKVQPTVKTKTKGRRSLSLKHSNVAESCPVQTKARELVQKAKLTKRSPKGKVKRLSMSKTKKKALSEDPVKKIVKQSVVQVNMVQVDSDVVLIDDEEATPVKPTKKKRQMLLKPPSASTPKTKLVKKKIVKSKMTNKSTTEEVEVVEDTAVETSRRSSRQAAANAKKMIEEQQEVEEEEKVQKIKKIEKEKPVKESKLAPIFCKKKVIELSPSKLKARQDFLQSGVPDQIKKQVLIEKSQEEEVSGWPPFPAVSHVQQKNDADVVWNLDSPNIEKLKETAESVSSLVPLETKIYSSDIMSILKKDKSSTKQGMGNNPTLDLTSIVAILLCLKKENPYFPAFSVFKSYLDLKRDSVDLYKKELEKEESKIKVIDLEEEEEEAKRGKRKRRSKGSGGSKRSRLSGAKGKKKDAEEKEEGKDNSLPLWQERIPHAWTQVFSPKHSNQVIGNTGHIRKMKMWLQEWKRKSEIYANKEKNGKKKKTFRRDDDFLISDDSSSFADDDFVNTFLLSGPPGIGKTSAVYALAAELGYKVLEVNASSRRQGRQVMTQLAEATQSHSVSSNASQQPANTLTAMFAAKTSAKPSPKKVSLHEDSQNSSKDLESKKKVALVLFEDIDIVFEEWDEGFITTVNNFMATSKRPIILTVSHSSPNVLAKIKGNYEKLDFVSPPVDLIAHHLQLVCLANGHHICLRDVQTLVQVNEGDVRQSLHDLQLWAMSGSSFQRCNCLENSQKDDSQKDREVKKNDSSKAVKDVSLSDIFPDADQLDTSSVELYQSGLWGKVQGSAVFESQAALNCDRRKTSLVRLQETGGTACWSQISSNLPLLLPLPLAEMEETQTRYPLQPDDPLLKTTHLWQRHSWLSIDEDEDEVEQQPVTEEKKEEEEEEEKKKGREEAPKIPPNIQKSSKQCLESMAHLYDTIAQLDVLDSSQLEAYPGKSRDERGWWTRHPSAGLSDVQDKCDLHWAPHSLTNELIQFIGQRAVKCCHEEVSAALPKGSVTDWPQLSLKIQKDMRVPSLIPHESKANSLRQEHRNITAFITSRVPAVNHLNRNLSMDYLPCIRSLVRFDELGAAISKNRRGRRFLSNVAHLGIDLSAEEKLKMANAFLS